MFTSLILAVAMTACSSGSTSADTTATTTPDNAMTSTADTTSARVEVETSVGNFTILLYGDTPRHRDNFLKLVNEGYYDGTLFHRVIKEFMVQAGDPDSKTAQPGQQLGAGDPGYTIEAEFVYPKHFHKRGALAAARTGDQMNPERRSSGSQFYVVTGKKYTEPELAQIEERLDDGRKQAIFGSMVQQNMARIQQMQAAGDQAGLQALQQQLIEATEAEAAKNPTRLTPEQRQAYTTVGGSPFLDGQYTVFGEVLSGMDTIEKIEKAATDGNDRPTEDIRIKAIRVIK